MNQSSSPPSQDPLAEIYSRMVLDDIVVEAPEHDVVCFLELFHAGIFLTPVPQFVPVLVSSTSESHIQPISPSQQLPILQTEDPSPLGTGLMPVLAVQWGPVGPPVACFFCRGRKIACSAPPPGSQPRICKYVLDLFSVPLCALMTAGTFPISFITDDFLFKPMPDAWFNLRVPISKVPRRGTQKEKGPLRVIYFL